MENLCKICGKKHFTGACEEFDRSRQDVMDDAKEIAERNREEEVEEDKYYYGGGVKGYIRKKMAESESAGIGKLLDIFRKKHGRIVYSYGPPAKAMDVLHQDAIMEDFSRTSRVNTGSHSGKSDLWGKLRRPVEGKHSGAEFNEIRCDIIDCNKAEVCPGAVVDIDYTYEGAGGYFVPAGQKSPVCEFLGVIKKCDNYPRLIGYKVLADTTSWPMIKLAKADLGDFENIPLNKVPGYLINNRRDVYLDDFVEHDQDESIDKEKLDWSKVPEDTNFIRIDSRHGKIKMVENVEVAKLSPSVSVVYLVNPRRPGKFNFSGRIIDSDIAYGQNPVEIFPRVDLVNSEFNLPAGTNFRYLVGDERKRPWEIIGDSGKFRGKTPGEVFKKWQAAES